MLELEHYRPTALESAVVSFYKKKGITNPCDINLEVFAYDAGIWIHELPMPSTNYHFKHGYTIVLDNRLPYKQQRVELAHELGHILLHCGRQEFMTDDFRALQEWQADRFAMYALAPTFMIGNYLDYAYSREQLVSHLADVFNVPDVFMDTRLDLLEQRIRTLAAEAKLAEAIREASASYDYSFRHPLNHRIEYLVRDGQVIGRRRRAEI
ncbi:hypothetical protein DNHGIG_14660 [Collibacillus ludicampi]|uniref:IrrE N-terminal-like domain-containing protein n=1 Tax=Collibacillus ludicampi TaxID=2771369 RepID=A0AAV4LDR0_9BACL|nr:ImmA/IrrE family metallo-endopeptidase [Collibacillus ludicampi]GIM45917.1 hypothetical protein DNHGIG_14660 [Collibacillus ludicampi]